MILGNEISKLSKAVSMFMREELCFLQNCVSYKIDIWRYAHLSLGFGSPTARETAVLIAVGG